MKILIRYILMLFITGFISPVFAGERTAIEILSSDCDSSLCDLNITVTGASKSTEVLVFAEYDSHRGLKIATDKTGEPYIAERITNEQWSANFKLEGPIKSIYAISTFRKDYERWGKTRDLYALKRLGIENLGTINQVLNLLKEFGWTPTGYTFIGETNLRNKYSPFEQSNTSNICQTTFGECVIIEYSLIGTPCFCVIKGKPIRGMIIRKNGSN